MERETVTIPSGMVAIELTKYEALLKETIRLQSIIDAVSTYVSGENDRYINSAPIKDLLGIVEGDLDNE